MNELKFKIPAKDATPRVDNIVINIVNNDVRLGLQDPDPDNRGRAPIAKLSDSLKKHKDKLDILNEVFADILVDAVSNAYPTAKITKESLGDLKVFRLEDPVAKDI